ncbi:MAG: hypothetical protein A2075_01170 [Geobacteraceae bacterium GWC2_58_44]|nr:MAG: hypothetical protein A2075_01170 [Geobacteraceae bacterium GWC2_58_44]HBG04143.1 hypothetical protein [Geobacter sp.]
MKKQLLGLAASLGVMMYATGALAATGAGVSITNTATARYNVGAAAYSVNASATPFKVSQLVNVSVTNMDGGQVPVATSATGQATSFRIKNEGNGPDNFILTVNNLIAGDSFDPTFSSIVLDSTGDGAYNTGDQTYVTGAAIALTAGQELTVFVLNDIPAAANTNTGITQVQAQSNIFNSGILGTAYPGAGVGGVDAVLGVVDGASSGQGTYVISSVTVTLEKTSVIADPWGGSQAVPGATVTYSIKATVSGSGTATGLKIVDPIPANTTYKSSTMQLNGAPLTDAGSDDAGDVNITTPSTVTVNLGNVAAGAAASTVSFQVTIN